MGIDAAASMAWRSIGGEDCLLCFKNFLAAFRSCFSSSSFLVFLSFFSFLCFLLFFCLSSSLTYTHTAMLLCLQIKACKSKRALELVSVDEP